VTGRVRAQDLLRRLCYVCLVGLATLVLLDWLVVESEDGDALVDDLRLAVAFLGLLAGLGAIIARRREDRDRA
jgi:hypothetical protein